MEIEKEFDDLLREIKYCTLCDKVDHRQMYPGRYREGQKYFFVGASPWNFAGPEEAFRVGKASQNFDKLLKESGIDRQECFTTNAVIHIPIEETGSSRQPSVFEIFNCSKYLKKQLEIVNPKIVVALGAIALNSLKIISYHNLLVGSDVGTGIEWNNRYLFVLTHPSPNAVSFRGWDLQVNDYKALKQFYEEKINV